MVSKQHLILPTRGKMTIPMGWISQWHYGINQDCFAFKDIELKTRDYQNAIPKVIKA